MWQKTSIAMFVLVGGSLNLQETVLPGRSWIEEGNF